MKKFFIIIIVAFLIFIVSPFGLIRKENHNITPCPPSPTEREKIELSLPKEVIEQDIINRGSSIKEDDKEKRDPVFDKIEGIKELSVNFSKSFTEIESYQDLYNILRVYYVAVSYEKEDGRKIDYKIYVLGLDKDKWVVAESIPAPLSIIANSPYRFNTKEEKKALERYD